jgi:hypothetical protein
MTLLDTVRHPTLMPVKHNCRSFLTLLPNNGTDKFDHTIDIASGLSIARRLDLQTVTSDLLNEVTKVRLIGSSMLAKLTNQYLYKTYTSSVTMKSGSLAYKPHP